MTYLFQKKEIENIFLPAIEQITVELLQKNQNVDPVIRQLKSWPNSKTKPIKADITILGNKTLLRYFRKFKNTSLNENTNILEYQTPELKVLELPLSKILLDTLSRFTILKDKRFCMIRKNKLKYYPNFLLSKCIDLDQCIIQRLHNRPVKEPYPDQKQIAEKQDFEGKPLYFNQRVSFDTKGPISPFSGGNLYIMVIVDVFTH